MESVTAPRSSSVAAANPFLFPIPGGQPIDLYPVLKDGANMHCIRAAIARETGDSLKGYNAIYHRIRRFLKRLESAGFLVSKRGILDYGLDEKPCSWWRPTQAGLYLIRQVQNSNPCKLPPRSPDIFEGDTLRRQLARGPFKTRYPDDRLDPRPIGRWLRIYLGRFGIAPEPEIPRWVRFPKRSSLTRLKAASRLCQIHNDFLPSYKQRLFERIDTGQKKPNGDPITIVNPLLKAKLAEIREYYEYYLEEIADKTIVLVNKDAETPAAEDFKTLPYRTRFNDWSRSARALDKYEAAWTEAEKYYTNAVFLTLTTDPKKHSSLWRANRHMAVAWNRYTALLTKRARDGFIDDLRTTRAATLKTQGYTPEEVETLTHSDEFEQYLEQELQGRSFRPRYIAVNEFMENGLLHMHIIVFGTSWIAKRDKISADWDRCGQGKIVKAIAVHRNHVSGVWEWSGSRPEDAAPGESPRDYLKKYLNKAIHDRKGFELYWAVNKPFMSSSRRFDPARMTIEEEVDRWVQKIKEKILKEQNPSYWTYAFCSPSPDIPRWMDWYDRRNRRNVQPPPVLTENILPTIPYYQTADERRIEHLRRKGHLKFRTALEIYRERKPTVDDVGPTGTGGDVNPATGRPYSLADFL
ncbi:MAG: hypothetical protein WC343_08065 [Bacilli bacterium]|jgi:hypothetical protein